MNNKLLPINSDDNKDKTNKAKIYNYKSKEIVNKEKIKNLKINIDEVNKIANKNNIIHKKIQLWTNDKSNEYAIRLFFDSDQKKDNAQFIASTNPNEKYIHPIAETDNIKDLQHGWDYTLRELIENYKKNYYQKISGEGVQSIKLIPFYKCTYCNKELSSQEEKKEHEFVWHI
ncbi:MAG: hypothetical protein ACXWE0_02610 [Nitrososphaeraceae archaeon]